MSNVFAGQSLTLEIPFQLSSPQQNDSGLGIPTSLLHAIRHQNLIGWDCFLRGYTFIMWKTAFFDLLSSDQAHLRPDWDTCLVALAVYLLTNLESKEHSLPWEFPKGSQRKTLSTYPTGS